ncbi:hypothetical protein BCR42DRAFT_423803 [Absidia repens]|uniref:NAD(P)-binding domain-containing protein n=1 Tax=Absidia repens TaxID=90262 RepID=A0A1X2I5L4_9FUNG|nr:hypothetical protein BCR42DRAFT_423803 [Absidia repens]
MVSILILGLGWSSLFLTDLLSSDEHHRYTYAATTRDGRNDTIPWTLSDDPTAIDVSCLPDAETILVTFPVKNAKVMKAFVDAYDKKKSDNKQSPAQWIILSSTRPFTAPDINNRHSPLDSSVDNNRIPSEEVVLERNGTVLHLAGLWGAQRQPKNWVSRFAIEEKLKGKLLVRQLHLIHGKDVARAVLATHTGFQKAAGQRWIVTDGGCYDWLRLFCTWASSDQLQILQHLLDHDHEVQQKWGTSQTVSALVEKDDVTPRLDSSDFWTTFALEPKEFLSVE